MLRLWFTEEMRWRHNRLLLVIVVLVDIVALATPSWPSTLVAVSLTSWLAFRIWRWNVRRVGS